jgi:outer membrane receptor protein involved in Fe transport
MNLIQKLVLISSFILNFNFVRAGCIWVFAEGKALSDAAIRVGQLVVISDTLGRACMELAEGKYEVVVSFSGFWTWQGSWNGQDSLRIELTDFGAILPDVNIYSLEGESLELRSPQSVQKVSNYLISNTNIFNFAQFIDKLPATTISDGQISLRGSGFMLNSASRVMVLVDGVPFLTTDYNDVRWASIPTELIDYSTLLKGSSSVSYGSNSLYGVLDLRTLWPDSVARTQVLGFYQTYLTPDQNRAWWTAQNRPFQQGFSLRHLNPLTSKLDLVLSFNHLRNQSFLQTVYNEHSRLSFKLRYKISPNSNLGLEFHGAKIVDAEFLVWNDTKSGMFKPYSRADSLGSVSLPKFEREQFNSQFYYNFKYKNFQNTFRIRLLDLKTLNFRFNVNTRLFGGEYHSQLSVGQFKIKAGGNLQHFFYHRLKTTLEAYSAAGYALSQWQKGRFNFNGGLRYEAYWGGGLSAGFPIFSAGANYWSGNWLLRTNFGQGFRVPSFGERLISLEAEVLPIWANDKLKPERGYTFEMGAKRTLEWGAWKGYCDAALFMNYFDNYIELIPGVYADSLRPPYTLQQIEENFGFKYLNINQVRNGGLDLTAQGSGKIGLWDMRVLAGYLYSYSIDAQKIDAFTFAGSVFESMWKGGSFITEPILYGRQRGLSKFDVEWERKGWLLGLDLRHYGAIEKLQEIYEVLIPGLQEYRRQNAGGKWVIGFRAGYSFGKWGRLLLMGANLTNQIYSIRPARAEAPRNFTMQFKVDF